MQTCFACHQGALVAADANQGKCITVIHLLTAVTELRGRASRIHLVLNRERMEFHDVQYLRGGAQGLPVAAITIRLDELVARVRRALADA